MKITQAQHSSRLLPLDGVRGLAVLAVFLIHAGFWSYGWIGVPVFFALSGFLITGILRRSRKNYWFWKPFYFKRATRIMPPLVIAYLGAAMLFRIPWLRVGPYFFFFLANVGAWKLGDDPKTLGVLWSLAIEEQFYFIWPFAVRYLSRNKIIKILVFILIFEPILRAISTPYFNTFWAIFLLTPFQLDGLAAGSLLAILCESSTFVAHASRYSGAMFWTVVMAFCGLSYLPSFHREANTIIFNSLGYTVLALISVSLICYVSMCEGAFLGQILSKRSIVFIGSISYGAYLFHPLVLSIVDRLAVQHGFRHLRLWAPLGLVITICVSYISFHFYEAPIMRWGQRKVNKLYAQSRSDLPAS